MTKRWAVLFSSILWTACGASPEPTQLAKSAVSDATCPTGRNACCSKLFPPGDSRGQQCISAAAHGEGPCAAAENCGGQCPVIGGLNASSATLPAGTEFLLSPGIIDTSPPGVISYDWHLVGGSVGILEPVTPDAIFVCTSIGVQTVELTITGGNPKGDCTSSSTLTIDCTSLCGNEILDSGEYCDYSPMTPVLCRNCSTTNCGACLDIWSGVPRGGGVCSGLSVDDTQACNALISCAAPNMAYCATGLFGVLGCYCSDPTCSAGANGPCPTQFQALAHSDDPAVVRAQIADPSTPVGRIAGALQRFSSFCGSACFVFNN